MHTENTQLQPIGFFEISDLTVKAPNHLIKGFLETDSNTVIYGESGAGKSFVTLDAAFTVAAASINPNINFFGMTIADAGPVVYVCGEGQNGISKRIKGLQQKYRIEDKNVPFYMTKGGVILNNPTQVSQLLMTCEQIKAKDWQYPKMIIFDTLNKSFNGNENSADDVGALVRAMDDLRRVTGACVVVVHHTGKGGEMRGSSALRAGIDNQIGVFLDEEDPMNIVIKNEKMKDSGKMDDLTMTKRIVKVGYDERFQEDITTLVLESKKSPVADNNTNKLSAVQKDIIGALESLGGSDIGFDEVLTELNAKRRDKVTRKSFKQSVDRLASDKKRLVAYSADNQFLTIIK